MRSSGRLVSELEDHRAASGVCCRAGAPRCFLSLACAFCGTPPPAGAFTAPCSSSLPLGGCATSAGAISAALLLAEHFPFFFFLRLLFGRRRPRDRWQLTGLLLDIACFLLRLFFHYKGNADPAGEGWQFRKFLFLALVKRWQWDMAGLAGCPGWWFGYKLPSKPGKDDDSATGRQGGYSCHPGHHHVPQPGHLENNFL